MNVSIRGKLALPKTLSKSAETELSITTEKLHQALGYKTPDEVYFGKRTLTKDGKIVMQK